MQPRFSKLMQQMVEPFVKGGKASSQLRLGIERERIALIKEGLRPLPFDGELSISALLHEWMRRYRWQPLHDGEQLIGLKQGEATLTLEPAGQIEFSSLPVTTVAELAQQMVSFDEKLMQTSFASRLILLNGGLNPLYSAEEMPWIPKQRYRIMRKLLGETDLLGTEMMALTSSTQVAIDYTDEEDCEAKYILANALVPIITALYANSPITQGRKSGFISYRAYIWSKTDQSRCGIPPFAYEYMQGKRGGLFAAYRDHALQVPLFFDLQGELEPLREAPKFSGRRQTFMEFLSTKSQHAKNGNLEYAEIESAWQLHLSSLFPEVRLKNFLELRSADGNATPLAFSYPALCKGLFYNIDARQEAWKLLQRFSADERRRAMQEAMRVGLSTAKFGRYTILELSRELYGLAEAALKSEVKTGYGDAQFLLPLAEIIFGTRRSPGESVLELWESVWRRSPQELIEFLSKTSSDIPFLTRDTKA